MSGNPPKKPSAGKYPRLVHEGDPPRLNDYVPTDELRTRVRRLAMLGVPMNKIATDLGISIHLLKKHYQAELDKGDLESLATVSAALWRNAVEKDNVIAQIFLLKSRHNWIDRKEVNHNHTVGPALSHEERLDLLAAAPNEGTEGIKFTKSILDSTAEDLTDEEALDASNNFESQKPPEEKKADDPESDVG